MMKPTSYSLVPQIEKQIKSAKCIYISAHTNADPDALCSVLALYNILHTKFPKKKIIANLEGVKPLNLSYLMNFNQITSGDSLEIVSKNQPDLLILMDIDSPKRITLNNIDGFSEICEKKQLVVIDHHVQNNWPSNATYLNNILSSACEEVYNIFIKKLGYKLDIFTAEILLSGILLETNRFLWPNKHLDKTFKITLDLLDKGLDIEEIYNKSNRYPPCISLIYQELFKNLTIEKGYNYSYISDEFTEKYIMSDIIKINDFKMIIAKWTQEYLKNIEPNKAGFITYLTQKTKENNMASYSVSLRSADPKIHVNDIALKLGGGGHQFSSAARITAKNIKEVIKKVIKTIENPQTNK